MWLESQQLDYCFKVFVLLSDVVNINIAGNSTFKQSPGSLAAKQPLAMSSRLLREAHVFPGASG